MPSPEEYYKEQAETELKLLFESSQSRASFVHHLTLVSATLLGILVAFHPSPSAPRLHLWVFFLAVASLAASILLLLFASNACTSSLQELYLRFHIELEDAIRQRRRMKPFSVRLLVNIQKFVSYALALLSLAVVLLVIYVACELL